MPILRQRPKLGPILVTALVVLTTCGLGAWQVKRLEWKNTLIQTVEARLELEPVALPLGAVDAGEWAYRRIVVSGRYLFDKEHFVQAISPQGVLGYRVMTPLVRSGGTTVLVERAWIPFGAEPKQSDRDAAQVERGVVGMLRLPQAPNWIAKILIPLPDVQKRIWYNLDMDSAAQALGVDLEPFFVEPLPGGSDRYDTTAPFRLEQIPNNHLAYAVTWFALALCSLAIFVLYHRRKEGS